MITPEQRRKLEAEWSSDDRSIVRMARLARAAVMLMLIVGLAWIGSGNDSSNNVQQASAPTSASSLR